MLGLIVKVSTFDDIGLVSVRKICTFPLDFKYSADHNLLSLIHI